MDQTPLELAETFASVARALLGEDDVEATLKKITTLAVDTIDGCDHAGVSLVQGRRISTPAASDDVPGRVDAVQYETRRGLGVRNPRRGCPRKMSRCRRRFRAGT